MNLYKSIFFVIFALSISLLTTNNVSAGHWDVKETDTQEHALGYFFDLRDRETYIQVTNTDSEAAVLHIQIWNVNDNCNENNFFDNYTPNDTHVYNMRDILTNDGNPSGVDLPDDAYGAVIIYVGEANDADDPDDDRNILMGNMRILDENGYEYRTNASGFQPDEQPDDEDKPKFTFNFNTTSGVTLSDVIFFGGVDDEDKSSSYDLSNILDAWMLLDVNILDSDENLFSCRNVVFSCVDEDNPLLEALLEEVADAQGDGSASVASFEYGINNTIPHSKGAPLLCPGNTISEGVVIFDILKFGSFTAGAFVGLNNGNGRGSFDMWWWANFNDQFPD